MLPLTGWCHIDVTQRRWTAEWIDCMQAIADDYYQDAARIRLVLVNLSTHNPAAFYRFFPPEKAREYLDRFEFYYTPTHGSWLNMAEITWSSLQTQCLNRRIPDAATLRSEVAAWERARNEMDVTVNWQSQMRTLGRNFTVCIRPSRGERTSHSTLGTVLTRGRYHPS